MREYDANEYEIQKLKDRLDAEGITKDEFDIGNYSGLTYRELCAVVEMAIVRHRRKR